MLRAITQFLIPLTYAQLALIKVLCSTDCVCALSTKLETQNISVRTVCQGLFSVCLLASVRPTPLP